MKLLTTLMLAGLAGPLAAEGLHDIRKLHYVDGRALVVVHTCIDPATIPAQYEDRVRYAIVTPAAPSRLDQASQNVEAVVALQAMNAVVLIGKECLADFLTEFESRGGSQADLAITTVD